MRSLAAYFQSITLALWLGILLTTGTAAAVLFPAMKELNPTLPGFAGYTGEHWLIAAGRPATSLFRIYQCASGVLAGLTVISLIVTCSGRPRGWMRSPSMTVYLFLMLALVVVQVMEQTLHSTMRVNLMGYWEMAGRHETAAALNLKDQFGALHKQSELITGIEAVLLAFAILVFGYRQAFGLWNADATLDVHAPQGQDQAHRGTLAGQA